MMNPVTPPASTTSGSSSTPLVTIVVRSMARPELGQALASLAAQDYPALEVVVVDATGGAHPPLPEVRWRPRHRVRLVGNGRRLDRAAAANLGLESVAGEYFGYLDDDDTCTSAHVSTLVRAAFAHPEALAVYGRARWLGPDGRLERLHGLPFNRALLYHGPIMCWQAALFRSSVIALGCRFRGELDGVEDRDFVAQVADRGDLAMIDAATFCFRPDVGTSGTGVGANFDRGRTARADLRLRTAWFGSGTLHTERAAHLGRRALAQVLAGRTGAARALLERTLVEYPEDPNALHGLARLALATGELDRAESLVERAIAVHAGVADFHRTRDEIRDARAGRPFAASVPPPPAARTPGRLAPCPCGSGLRYKACCGRVVSAASLRTLEATAASAARYDDVQGGDVPATIAAIATLPLSARERAEALATAAERALDAGHEAAALDVALAAIGLAETRRTRSVLEACGARIDRRERDRSLRDAARRLLERYRTPSPGDRGSIHIIGDGRAAHPDRERAQLLLARHPGARPWSVAPGPANVGPGTPWEPVEAASPDAFDGGYLVLLPGSDPLGLWFESIAPRAIVVAHPPEDAEGIVRRLAQIDTYRLECAVDVWPSSPRAADRDADAWPTHVRAQA
ncbi:MAG: glycosyltransferase [Betaproteobacteria bacterium]|nr:glycosyltransferase [Betaproteobacteria bacterium]